MTDNAKMREEFERLGWAYQAAAQQSSETIARLDAEATRNADLNDRQAQIIARQAEEIEHWKLMAHVKQSGWDQALERLAAFEESAKNPVGWQMATEHGDLHTCYTEDEVIVMINCGWKKNFPLMRIPTQDKEG